MSEMTDGIGRYDGYVPDFIEYEVERLYGGRFPIAGYFRSDGGPDGAGAYRVVRGGLAAVALLHRREPGISWTMERMIEIPQKEIGRFVSRRFGMYPQVRRIDFDASATGARHLPHTGPVLHSVAGMRRRTLSRRVVSP